MYYTRINPKIKRNNVETYLSALGGKVSATGIFYKYQIMVW